MSLTLCFPLQGFGGKGANQAIAAGKLGADTVR